MKASQCKKCGGDPVLVTFEGTRDFSCHVACDDCNAHTDDFISDCDNGPPAREKAINEWNCLHGVQPPHTTA